MTPREVVTRAIEFRTPPRLPISGYGEASDATGIGYEQIKPPQAQGDDALDQWLCRWGKTDVPNMGQVKGHPLEDLAGMKDFPWPDGNDPLRYANVPKALDEMAADPARRDKFTVTGIFMILRESRAFRSPKTCNPSGPLNLHRVSKWSGSGRMAFCRIFSGAFPESELESLDGLALAVGEGVPVDVKRHER